jgi:FkbM family methyltransferase
VDEALRQIAGSQGRHASQDNRLVSSLRLSAVVRKAVRAPLRRLGFDVVRYDASRSPKARRARVLDECSATLVIDVGANDGPFGLALREAGYRGRIVSFEPQEQAFNGLEQVSRSDPLWDCCRLALGSADGEIDLHVAGNSSSSSVLEMTAQHAAGAPQSTYVSTERVTVRRLDSIREQIARPEDAVYLKLDVQGFELEVLRGADAMLNLVVAVETELSLVPLYHGGARMIDVLGYLGSRGFQLIAIEPVFVDPRDGHLLQIDGIFTRVSS